MKNIFRSDGEDEFPFGQGCRILSTYIVTNCDRCHPSRTLPIIGIYASNKCGLRDVDLPTPYPPPHCNHVINVDVPLCQTDALDSELQIDRLVPLLYVGIEISCLQLARRRRDGGWGLRVGGTRSTYLRNQCKWTWRNQLMFYLF